MKNHKVIVINGFGRGGTNIVWNILQSHPAICSPIYETNEVLSYLFPPRTLRLPFVYSVLRKEFILRPPLLAIAGASIDVRLYVFKLRNLTHSDNRFKFEGVPYTKDEVRNSVLCLKSIAQDIYLTELLSRIYEECFFVGLVRDGFALCEGWGRRGLSPEAAGRHYREIGEKMIEDSQRYKRYIIVKFEDVLRDPFGMASVLYKFAEVEPTKLEKLRLKTKKVLSPKGEHKTRLGEVGKKYWFTPETIHQIIVPDISNIQAQALSFADRSTFEREAKPVLDYFGYRYPVAYP